MHRRRAKRHGVTKITNITVLNSPVERSVPAAAAHVTPAATHIAGLRNLIVRQYYEKGADVCSDPRHQPTQADQLGVGEFSDPRRGQLIQPVYTKTAMTYKAART